MSGATGALRDCEAILDSFVGQPVNTLTSFAFVVAGVLVVWRSTLSWVGVALVATGAGSAVFHGPMPGLAQWAHDVSLAWLILVIAGTGRRWAGWTCLPGLAALSVLIAVIPSVAVSVAIGLTVVAVVLVLQRDRSLATVGPLGLLALAGLVERRGATGGPWCDSAAVVQLHAVWHVAAATAVTWWTLGTAGRVTRSADLGPA